MDSFDSSAPVAPASLAGSARSWLRPEILAIVLVVLTATMTMAPNVADPDLWGHVQFGRDALRDGEIAATTSYSYTAVGHPWINHENLSEIVMAIVADSLGPTGLVLGKFLLSLLVVILVLRANLIAGSGLMVGSVMTLLVAANLGYHWSIRPQLSSFVCFTLLLTLCDYAFAGWQGDWHWPVPRRWFRQRSTGNAIDATGRADIRARLGYASPRLRMLWLVVPLMMVWANAHGGFVAGVAVLTLLLGLRAVEALFRGHQSGSHNAGWGITRRMVLMGTVGLLATLINPYGPGLHAWLAQSLGSPRPEISDWSSGQLWTVVGMKLWLMVGFVGVAVIGSRRRRDLTQLILLSILLWQSLSHFRHVPFFALAAGFWMGPHLKSALDRFATGAREVALAGARLRLAQAGLAVGIALVGYQLTVRLSDLRVERSQFPVDALAFMKQEDLHGRVVVTYDWAQYAIAALCSSDTTSGPLSRVAFDGRFRTCYPQTVVDMHFDFLYGDAPHMPRHRSPQSPPIDSGRVLRYGMPDLVLLRRFGEQTEKHMRENTDTWVLLYQDAIAQVWGRRSIYGNPDDHRWVPESRRVIHNRLAGDSVTWPAFPKATSARSESTDERHLPRESDSELSALEKRASEIRASDPSQLSRSAPAIWLTTPIKPGSTTETVSHRDAPALKAPPELNNPTR